MSTKGHISTIRDLKGAKIGVSRLAGAEDSYGKLVASKAGIEGMQYTSTGGVEASMALLVTGGIDGVVLTPHQMIDLELQGKVKEIAEVEKYKPQPWVSYTIVAARISSPSSPMSPSASSPRSSRPMPSSPARRQALGDRRR